MELNRVALVSGCVGVSMLLGHMIGYKRGINEGAQMGWQLAANFQRQFGHGDSPVT